jgi:hypothetical protein
MVPSPELEIHGRSSRGQLLRWRVAGEQDFLYVGSHPGCLWRIDGHGVSPVHFDLVVERGQMWIGPRAPLAVDGAPVDRLQPLPSGAVIDFAGQRLQVVRAPVGARDPLPREPTVVLEDEPTRLQEQPVEPTRAFCSRGG